MPTNPTGGSVAVLKIGTATIPAMDWKLDMDAKLKDVANFKDGRHQKSGLADADFSAKILWDADLMPHDPAGSGIVPGAAIICLCYTSATKFFSAPIAIAKCTASSEIEGVVMYDVTGKQNGPIVFPVIP
jgi:hypothetical protein